MVEVDDADVTESHVSLTDDDDVVGAAVVVNTVLTPRITSPTSNPACSAFPLDVMDVMNTI